MQHITKNGIKRSGFTIVELLIVIVVIGILAAITIVAYNGVQNRSKTAAGQALANSIGKKADAWGAVKGAYPTYAQLVAGDSAVPEAKIDTLSSVQQAGIDSNTANAGKTVTYQGCVSQNGGYTQYFNFTTNAPVTTFIGSATTGSNCG